MPHRSIEVGLGVGASPYLRDVSRFFLAQQILYFEFERLQSQFVRVFRGLLVRDFGRACDIAGSDGLFYFRDSVQDGVPFRPDFVVRLAVNLIAARYNESRCATVQF